MLGITVPEAISFGSLVVAGLVAYLGTQKGDRERTRNPPSPAMALLGASLVDTSVMRELIDAVRGLAAAVSGRTQSRQTEALERLIELIDEKQEQKRAPRRKSRSR